MEKTQKFNYENFDYEKCYNEVLSEIKKPNILICGQTGVGKSSLINDIFENNLAPVGDGRPKTRGIHKYSGETINIYDSAGYELDQFNPQEKSNYYDSIISFIDKKRKDNPGDMSDHIHEVWYCVSAGNKRFLDVDKDIIDTIKQKKVPVMLIVTKVDLVSEDELNLLTDEIYRRVPSLDIFTYSTMLKDLSEEEAGKYVQKAEIINWALTNLTSALQLGFIPALKGSLKEMRANIMKSCVALYSGMAAAVVVGTSWVPVPFSDSVPLMGIQIKMAMAIINAYNIKTDAAKIIPSLAGTSALSYIGKTLASQLISVIPVVGGGIKATVNVGVAASITAVWGAAISLICEQYLNACINAGGAENLPFSEFISKDKINEAIKFVSSNKDSFNINEILKFVTNNVTKDTGIEVNKKSKISNFLNMFSKNKK